MTLDLVTVSGVRGFMQLTSQAVSMTMQDSLKKKLAASNRRFGYLHMHADHHYPSYVCTLGFEGERSACGVVTIYVSHIEPA